MTTLKHFKLNGTTGDAEPQPLSSVDVTLDSDNCIRFTLNGTKRTIRLFGDLALLMAEVFKGENGIPSTESRFDRPVLSAPGDGTRADA